MTNTILAYLIVFVVIAALIAGIVNMIKDRKSSGFASLTAFHDL